MTTIETPPSPEEIIETDKPTDNSMAEFYQLRNSLILGTVIIAVVTFGLVWKFYSLNVSLNYLLGACFSLVYLNLLAREVERVGVYKKRIGGTRLAIFVGLIIIATQKEQLQVMPIFLGFLTYKAAILFYILPISLLGNLQKSEKKG